VKFLGAITPVLAEVGGTGEGRETSRGRRGVSSGRRRSHDGN